MLISDDYLAQQKILHTDKKYGSASLKLAPYVIDIIENLNLKSVSDYGAGKCRLKSAIDQQIAHIDYYPYDPSFAEYGEARPADLVCCIDVLEHIETEHLDAVLKTLAEITQNIGFFSVHTGPAKKVLNDGRNAHLIQENASWWLEKLNPLFNIIQLTPIKRGFYVVVEKKGLNQAQAFIQGAPHNSIKGQIDALARKIKRKFS